MESGDFDTFLKLSRESGASSYMYLQNVYCSGAVKEQAVSLALALSGQILGERGTYRVHGGGFAGTIQAFVRRELAASYAELMDSVFGKGACMILSIRPEGAIRIEP